MISAASLSTLPLRTADWALIATAPIIGSFLGTGCACHVTHCHQRSRRSKAASNSIGMATAVATGWLSAAATALRVKVPIVEGKLHWRGCLQRPDCTLLRPYGWLSATTKMVQIPPKGGGLMRSAERPIAATHMKHYAAAPNAKAATF
jgi:hypothetical protein